MPLLISSAEVEACLPMEAAIESAEAAFRLLSDGLVTMPQRTVTSVAPRDGAHLCMPAYVFTSPDILCVKVVTVYPANVARHALPAVQGVVLLYEPETGALLAIIEAERLTALRTGAAGGLAARLLARIDASEVAIFGVGVQARAQLHALATVRRLRSVRVWSRGDPRQEAFCREMSERLRLDVFPADSAEQAVSRADIVVTATNSSEPVFPGDLLRPGTHVTAIGAFARDTRELDSDTIRKGKVYVDHRAAALLEAGDISIPLHEGAIAPDHIVGEIGEVLTGRAPARIRAEEITVFKSVGLAVQDAIAAQRVYLRAKELRVGTEVALD